MRPLNEYMLAVDIRNGPGGKTYLHGPEDVLRRVAKLLEGRGCSRWQPNAGYLSVDGPALEAAWEAKENPAPPAYRLVRVTPSGLVEWWHAGGWTPQMLVDPAYANVYPTLADAKAKACQIREQEAWREWKVPIKIAPNLLGVGWLSSEEET